MIRRWLAIACVCCAALAAAGGAAEIWRYGLTGDAAAARLERDVRTRFDRRARDVDSLALRVAREAADLTDAASRQPDDLPALFDRLNTIAPEATGDAPSTTVTIYLRQPEGQYRILAWSDGPAEDVPADRLAGGSALFVVPGTLGLRLVSVQPITLNGRRIASAAAETVLARATGVGASSGAYQFETAFGPVMLSFLPERGDAAREPDRFSVTTPGGGGFDVQLSAAALRDARWTFRRRTFAVALLPLIAVALLATGVPLRRRRAARRTSAFLGWSLAAAGLVVGTLAVLVWLARLAGLPAAAVLAIQGSAALATVALLATGLWWRGLPRARRDRAGVRFVVEHLAAGGVTAACAWLSTAVLAQRITPAALVQWQRPLFPIRFDALAYLTGLLLLELSVFWLAATVLAMMAGRWRLRARRWAAWMAASVLWFAPAAALFAWRSDGPAPTFWPWVPAVLTAIVFALTSGLLRRRYRHTSQVLRLVLLYGCLLAPALALYPIAWLFADNTAREIIAAQYAPETMRRPAETLDVLNRVQREIDALPAARLLHWLVPPPGEVPVTSVVPAFDVWSRTSLATTRLTAAIELYDASGALLSRFALNMPEYQAGGETLGRSLPTSCDWGVFGEALPLGAEERQVLHARRQVCGADGRPAGSILVHVMNDYRALPFVSTPDPYRELLGAPDVPARGSILPDLQVVIYGWSFTPLFTSGNVAWPITPDLFARVYRSREPFWTSLEAEGRTYAVHVSNNSSFIYALGYPTSTWFEHLTRMAEAAALMAAIFVLWLVGATLQAPFSRPSAAPLRAVLDEIRTSFYRKLFLFFVLAAVGPVLLFALAFGVYLNAKLRADVETEAATSATVARRVLEQTAALGLRGPAFNDDVIVWVGQVLHQDVNLFEGPELVATSQRDLYASGLLPTRTPAKVYRAIALSRLPSFVGEEWLGPVSYLIAAAPVPAAGRSFVLSVPLASRQREIEREIDELSRGVLVGAVFVVLFAAGLGASVASRVSDPVARLSRATRSIAAGRLDVRLVAETADELSRLIEDFNSMTDKLRSQRAELARANQLQAWAEMARQVAHDIKNPLTPIQLAAEHLEHVHADQGRPLGATFDQCVATVLRQVRLLRQIASEFSNFAGSPTPRFGPVALPALLAELIEPYRVGLRPDTTIDVALPPNLPEVRADRTLLSRALANLIENALQAMPDGGVLRVEGAQDESRVTLTFADTGVGMDPEGVEKAFEPYFSTKTGGSGLGLANARRNIETCGGSIALTSAPGRGTTVTVVLPRFDPSGGPGSGSTPGR